MSESRPGWGPRHLVWLLVPAGLALVQIGPSFAAADEQPGRKAIDAIGVALLVVGPASLLLVRRWPYVPVVAATAAASLFIGLGYPFGPVFASVAAAFFAAVQLGRRRVVIGLAVVGAAGVLLAAALDPRRDRDLSLHVLLVLGWLTAVLAVAEIVRARREQIAERRRTEEAAREQRLADTRMRLAQELHDVLAHNISLVNVQASVALHLLEQQPDRAVDALANIKRASADALDELRAALDVLRDGESPRAPAPRLSELEGLIDGVRSGGVGVEVDADDVPSVLPGAVELAAYRIVQEALTNVTRHSNARSVAVRLAASDAELLVDVVDDGTAATPSVDDRGRGLIGMRERAASLGGTLTAGPTATGGFRVTAHLPLGTP